MSEVPYRVVLLDSSHNRKGFHSGVAPLDEYLHTVVSQDVKRRAATCYVALDKDDRIAGYYTVAMQHINLPDLPDDLRKKLPRYPTVPAVIMGRLAVDLAFKGIGLGGALLGNALNRMARSEFASYAMVVCKRPIGIRLLSASRLPSLCTRADEDVPADRDVAQGAAENLRFHHRAGATRLCWFCRIVEYDADVSLCLHRRLTLGGLRLQDQ
jgi:GNAT superfamily N-acetyltransferase